MKTLGLKKWNLKERENSICDGLHDPKNSSQKFAFSS